MIRDFEITVALSPSRQTAAGAGPWHEDDRDGDIRSGFSVASPIGTIKRTKFTADARELAKVLKDREVGPW